ncbi:MAG: hypothetical protein H6531_01720 [Actinobacteria bacterium]|nr:hypothetical protein [Thermoleophilia bacterium]MCB9010530.1 hypothetical protein [Actinomycetota bacterium]
MTNAPQLRCAGCGERIKLGRGPTGFTHISRIEAACDLNADHFPVPDRDLLGRVPCSVCGADVEWSDDGFVHVEATDHDPSPTLPLI